MAVLKKQGNIRIRLNEVGVRQALLAQTLEPYRTRCDPELPLMMSNGFFKRVQIPCDIGTLMDNANMHQLMRLPFRVVLPQHGCDFIATKPKLPAQLVRTFDSAVEVDALTADERVVDGDVPASISLGQGPGLILEVFNRGEAEVLDFLKGFAVANVGVDLDLGGLHVHVVIGGTKGGDICWKLCGHCYRSHTG